VSLASDIRALYRAYESGQDALDPSAVRQQTGIDVRAALDAFLDALETGDIRAAEPVNGDWQVNEWVKQGVLLNFALRDIAAREHGGTVYNDVVGLASTAEMGSRDTRNTPDGTVVRRGANVGREVILMSPSFVNIGARVGDGTLVDSCDTVGSCAQVGEGVKLGANSLVGGVLEPVEDTPVVIEDGVSLGAGCRVTSGFVVGENAVVGENTLLTPRIPVYDLVEERVLYGRLPPNRRALTRYVESAVGDSDLFDGGAYKPAVVATALEAETLEATAREEALREQS
jgi:2,3,4,5-tetrahydropyridine-2-carboxylate N-succinyltransferase